MKRSLLIIAIVIIMFAIVWLVYDSFKEQPVDANITDTNIEDENTGLDNEINSLLENVEVDDNESKEENKIENDIKDDEKKEDTELVNGNVTSKEEKAIKLVKKEWGTTSGVYFSNMGIDNKGRYIISVNDSVSTKTLAFFLVDVENEVVTKQ